MAANFKTGDVVHVTIASGYGTNSNKSAVILVSTDPIALTPLVIDGGFTGIGAFDPYRRTVLALRFGQPIASINASGAITNLPISGGQDASLLAPTGDGRVYLQRPSKWAYIDASNTTHDLLNSSQSGPFTAPRVYRRAHYDKATNCIFAGTVSGPSALIAKIPLSAGGTHVSGPVTEILLSTPALSGPDVVGISPGPDGKLFIKIDDNSGASGPRMLLLDPASLTQSTFAQSSYFGVGGEIAGCFVPTLNAALVVDSLVDQLRKFTPGSTGAGAAIPNTLGISSTGGSGETATMFPITASPCPADLNNDGVVEDADFSIFAQAYDKLDCADPSMPADCPSDLNRDGLVDDADFILFVAAYNELICP